MCHGRAELSPRPDVQFLKHHPEVIVHRPRTNEQLGCNLCIGLAPSGKARNLFLAGRKDGSGFGRRDRGTLTGRQKLLLGTIGKGNGP